MNPDNKKMIDVKTNISVIFNNENSNDGRFLRAFKKAGVKTIEDLCRRTEADLLAIKQIGQYCIGKIEAFLSAHGLTLAMTDEHLSAYAEEFDAAIPAEETAEKAASASDNEPTDDDNESNEESVDDLLMKMVDKVVGANDAKANERRRYELALDIFMNESEGFASTEERAISAVSKADIFLAAYYGK